jgi:hypothetical protein
LQSTPHGQFNRSVIGTNKRGWESFESKPPAACISSVEGHERALLAKV